MLYLHYQPLYMAKLYKIIVLFVGLIAVNINVQAQLDFFARYVAPAKVDNEVMTANAIPAKHTLQFTQDWAGVSNLFATKEVSDFFNYPNPAVTHTTIAYTLSAKANVSLKVIDLAGKQLAVLVKQEQAAGKQEYYWELAKHNISPGMYILILQVDNKILSRKIIVQ